jgi:hypothetical protein
LYFSKWNADRSPPNPNTSNSPRKQPSPHCALFNGEQVSYIFNAKQTLFNNLVFQIVLRSTISAQWYARMTTSGVTGWDKISGKNYTNRFEWRTRRIFTAGIE